MKFPQGEGSAVIHRKKNRPALQRRDILTVFFIDIFFWWGGGGGRVWSGVGVGWNLLSSSFTHFFVVLFFMAFYTAQLSSKHFILRLFVRSLFTQLVFMVVLLLLLLSMIAFSYVGFLSLFWVRLFHALYLSHLPSSSFLEGLSSEHFTELRSVHLLAFWARACSFAFLSLGVSFLSISRAVLI